MKFCDVVTGKSFVPQSALNYSVNDRLVLRGSVKMSVKCFNDDEFGDKEFVHHEKHNLIVNQGREILAELIAEVPGANVIDTFKLGISGHVDPGGASEDILTAVDPLATDADLIDASPYSEAINGFAYLGGPPVTSVKFTIVIGKTEANGSGVVAYTEAGLFSNGGELFSRETFPALVKNSSRQITIEWSILF